MHPDFPGMSFYLVPAELRTRARTLKPVAIIDGPHTTSACLAPGRELVFGNLAECLAAFGLPGPVEAAAWEVKDYLPESPFPAVELVKPLPTAVQRMSLKRAA